MRKLVAIVALGAILVGMVPSAALAHGGAALALGAFAVFNLLFLPLALVTWPLYAAPPPAVYQPPPAVFAPAPVTTTTFAVAPPARRATAAVSREVVYPHGRYLLYGDGVNRAYQWIWVPNPPPPGSAPGY